MDISNWVVPASAAFGGITGAFISGTFTKLTGARTAEVTLQTTHAKEQLEALAAYMEHLRSAEGRRGKASRGYVAAYYRAALLAPTVEIEDKVEQAHAVWDKVRKGRMGVGSPVMPGAREQSTLQGFPGAVEEEGTTSRNKRAALEEVKLFHAELDAAHAAGKAEPDSGPLVAKLTDCYQVLSESEARRLLSNGAERAQYHQAAEEARGIVHNNRVLLGKHRTELEDMVREWVRGYRSEHR
ncbi:hypothetical protein [Streptomyces sp. NPDC087297]|uniref:hypothetical protein n=1 Tax=Streptomyces sp. NPDC087297 TaxID=3365778 RepID=UPI00381005B5